MAEIEKYQVCFKGHQKAKSFATQDALVAWIYDQMCEQIPLKIRPLERIKSIKLGGNVVAARTVLHIWRMVGRVVSLSRWPRHCSRPALAGSQA
jgi:hypothetical protein